jgi:2-oxoglutarate/2-oxoacid ferredoxin oxidoreductase subunit alpha
MTEEDALMPVNDMVIRISGESGGGIVTIGEIFVRIAAFSGLDVFTFRTFPAEIIGGQVIFQARIADHQVLSHGDDIDVLISLNQQGYDDHIDDLRDNGIVVYDKSTVVISPKQKNPAYPIPVEELAKSINFPRGQNLVMIGAMIALFGLPMDNAVKTAKRRLGGHKDVLEKNLQSMSLGYQYVQENFKEHPPVYLSPPEEQIPEGYVMTGNQAIALGALKAGCRFFAGYPITPATDIMEFLAVEMPKAGGAVVQAEDESASINIAIGASYSGVRAMTATSGPGLSLMTESLGLASMAEVPLVIVDVQRAGPATGLPTKTSQGDLFLALYGSNDEAPRFVLAPSSVEDCFYQTVNAFNMAERFQAPVVLLTDQALGPRVETIPRLRFDEMEIVNRELYTNGKGAEEYKRYKLTRTGVSPMALPGQQEAFYSAEGLEHDEKGHPNYTPEMHRRMTEKRYGKMESARQQLAMWPHVFEEFGDENAAIGIMAWGSTMGPVQEAITRAIKVGIKVAAIFPKVLLPMPDVAIRRFLAGRRAIIIPELNYTGQFAKVVEHRYSRELINDGIAVYRLNKYEGLPFRPVEIEEKIYDVMKELVERRD